MDVPYRLLAMDLDGSAVRFDRTIAEVDLKAARVLREEVGVTLTIATGRLFSGSIHVAHAYGVRGAIACVNGSQCLDVESREPIDMFHLSGLARDAFRSAIDTHRLAPCILAGDEVHCGVAMEAKFGRFLRSWSTELQTYALPSELDAVLSGDDVLAVLATGSESHVSAAAAELELILTPRYELRTFVDFIDGSPFLKIRSAGTSKGRALAWIAESHGFSLDQCVALGDWTNDISMLEAVGLGFAMAQAPAELLEVADVALDTHGTEGGAIAQIAERVWGVRV